MCIYISNPETLNMCAVCISETSGGQMALLIIVVSLSLLGLLNRSWKKNFKKEAKLSNYWNTSAQGIKILNTILRIFFLEV